MASNPITESYFIIVAVIAATVLTAAIIPSIAQISQVYSQQAQYFQNKGQLQLTVDFIAGFSGQSTVTVWVKNTGIASLQPSLINQSDVFFGPTTSYTRIPYNAQSAPKWTYTLVNDVNHNGIFDPGDTMQIVLTLTYNLTSGNNYYFKITTYLGTASDYTFSV